MGDFGRMGWWSVGVGEGNGFGLGFFEFGEIEGYLILGEFRRWL